MKLIKTGSKDNYLESEPFNFKKINGLDKFDVLTSYVEGESPEYQNDIDKLLMVVEGSVNLKINKRSTDMSQGDMIFIHGGEKFQLNADNGAKLMQFNADVPIATKKNIMDFACKRHSIREFLDKPVSRKDIYYLLKIGMHAPSGGNRQPWKFIVVGDPEVKRKIREGAEQVEKKYYEKKNGTEFVKELKTMGLSWHKPFLETAPYLICVFGNHEEPFYKESLWLASGWLLLAAEELGLSTLTYTPENMRFLSEILKVNEKYKPELIIPIGYAGKAEKSTSRKDISEVVSFI